MNDFIKAINNKQKGFYAIYKLDNEIYKTEVFSKNILNEYLEECKRYYKIEIINILEEK